MKKILSLTLLALLLLPASESSSKASRYTALFCPECWTYLSGHGTTDMRGNCAACGKYPLELEVQTMKWFWCSHQSRWLQEECKDSARLPGCTREDSLAVVAKPGPDLVRAAYCPLHRSFNGVRMPLVGIMTCAVDGRPMVSVWAARRTWFWCDMEGQWVGSPCPLNPVKHCCTAHEGLLLATPEPGPIAGP
ncbi:MAG TPA: hypothetical protein VKW04_24670 [Planctomycetota bacterium]|nr:hypothetical protein [Planctomycetota bacterium]